MKGATFCLVAALSVPALAQPLSTPISSSQPGGSISRSAGQMKLNRKALEGFGDPIPRKKKPPLAGGKANRRPSAKRRSPAPALGPTKP